MAREGFDISKPVIIWDGNSLMYRSYNNGYVTADLNTLLGSGQYTSYNIAVGGQTVDDMQERLAANVLPLLNRHKTVIYICQPGRNQLKLTADTPAQVLTKVQTLFQTVKDQVSSTITLSVLTSASTLGGGDPTVMTDIPILNGLISAESSGYIDYKYDLYNNGNGFDDVSNKPPFSLDEVHYAANASGEGVHSDDITTYAVTLI